MKKRYSPTTSVVITTAVVILSITLMIPALIAGGNQPAGPAAHGDSLSITGISPNSGPVTGGTPIRVSGTDISNGATLTIKGIAAVNAVRVEDNGTTWIIKTVELAPYGFFHVEDVHGFLGVNGTVGAIELRSSGSNPAHFVAVSKVYAAITTQAGSSGTVSSFFFAEPIE